MCLNIQSTILLIHLRVLVQEFLEMDLQEGPSEKISLNPLGLMVLISHNLNPNWHNMVETTELAIMVNLCTNNKCRISSSSSNNFRDFQPTIKEEDSKVSMLHLRHLKTMDFRVSVVKHLSNTHQLHPMEMVVPLVAHQLCFQSINSNKFFMVVKAPLKTIKVLEVSLNNSNQDSLCHHKTVAERELSFTEKNNHRFILIYSYILLLITLTK